MTNRDFIRYSFVFLTFLGVFSTYPRAVHQARAEEHAGDVIYISTPQEFQDINLDLTAHYEIVNNIDFTGFPIEPIASSSIFTGILNGNNFVLSNIKLIIPSSVGYDFNFYNYYNVALIVNNSGTIQNLQIENINFYNNELNSIRLIDLPSSYHYILTFSLFVYSNNLDGIIENIFFRIFDINVRIGVQDYTHYSNQNYYLTVKVALFVVLNYGLINNIDIFISGLSSFSISGGYRRISSFEYSLINNNYGLIEMIRINYEGTIFLANEDYVLSSSWNHTQKSILKSSFLNRNYGTIREIIILLNNNLNITVPYINILDIKQSIISNISSNSSISQIRIINKSKINISLDHKGYGASLTFNYDLISNEIIGTYVSDVLIENDEAISFDLIWGSESNPIFLVTNVGALSSNSVVEKIIVSGNPRYQFYSPNSLWRIRIHYYATFRQLNGHGIFNFSLINIFPIIFINSSDSSLIRTVVSNSFFKVCDFINFNNQIVYSYLDYLFFASKVILPPNTITGVDETTFGIWNTIPNDYKYFINDGSFKSSTLSIYDIQEELLLDTSWSIDQLSSNGMPILTFTQIDFSILNNSTEEINYNFFIEEGIAVKLNNIPIESGTYFLNQIGYYNFELYNYFSINLVQLTISNEIINEYNNQSFSANFAPIQLGVIASELNGDPYTIGTPITTPGLHTLTIFGENGYEQDITFTIVLETNGVTDESTYTDSVTPTFSGGTATLNGEPFESGTEITDVGNYTLIILGVNGFREEINFKILPVITGLQDGVTKDPGFQPNITGEGITLELNGSPYTIGTPITTPGLHTLTIFGENGYEQDITFTIRLIFNGVSDNQTIVNNFVTITFSGGTARLNGTEIQSGFTTNKLGKYRLVIYGVENEVQLDYDFTILPDLQGLNNLIYTGNVQPNISGNSFSMTLNGVPYAGGNITMPGDHQLIIYGYTLDNLNQNEIMYIKNFRINVRVQNVANGENYLNQSKTIIISGGNATLNGQSIGLNHQVTSIGHYSLVISGVNGYIHEVNFTISPDINGVNEGQVYTSSTNIQVLGADAQVTLNGNPISNGILTYPGQHELVISGVGNFEVRRTFSIVATIDGVEDEVEYFNESRTITFSGGDATLNGTPIQSGYVLDRIGHFELTIAGVNGYSLTYNFTNLPEVGGVEEDVQYTASTNIQILGTGLELLMNGLPFTNRVYSEPGQHELEIFAAGRYYQLITFSIKPIISGGVLDGQIYINTPVNIVISGGNPTLNGVAIPLNHVVNEVGNYTLIIPQNNLPNVVIKFTINPALTKLSNNQTYNGSITPTIVGNGMTITLNGRPYVSGTTINNPGSNIIRITSTNGDYLNVINFTVNLVFSGLVDGVTYYDLITPTFSGGVVTLNGEPFESNTTITTLGDFELLIIGDNNYSRSYSFTIFPYNMSFPQDGASRDEVNLNIYRVHTLTEITLNEEEIRQTRLIQAVGHYDLVITFDGETISDTRFTVEPQDYIEDGSDFDSPVDIYHPHAIVKINGQEVSKKYRIEIQKQYTIEVFGLNDYYHTYTIKFYNPNLQDYQQLIAPMVATAIVSMAIFLMRKRWVS